MRCLILAVALPALLGAAPAFEIVKPIISQMDGGTVDPPGFEHAPGELLFFSCRLSGFTKSPDEKMQVSYSVQAFDPNGVPLTEIFQNEITAEVTPQDKEWQPKIATEIAVPPLIASGAYKIVVKAQDLLAKTETEITVPFRIRGRAMEPSDTLTVRNFRFFRTQDESEPVEKAAYKPGDGVFAQFDITGFKYGDKNKVDVSYVTSVIAPSGKVLWTQPEPAVEQSESFYPKRFVSASMGINLQKDIRPGAYVIGVSLKDAVGGQTFEGKFPFTIE